MRIPVYNEQLRYATRQQGGRINGIQYSGQIAHEGDKQLSRAILGLGDSLMQASDSVFNTNMKLNEADATKALTQYQREFLQKQTEIQKLKGEQALNASADFEKWQSQRTQELTKDLNPVAMGMFEQKAGVAFESNRQWVSEYQQQEEKRYEDGVFQTHLDTLKDTYLQNVNTPKIMQECKDQMFEAIHQYYLKNGMGQEVAKNAYKNTIGDWTVSGVNLLIDNEDLRKARTLLHFNRDYLSADEAAKLKKNIDSEQERLNAKFEQQLIGNTSKALFEQYRTDPDGAIKALTSNKNLTAEQQQKIAVNLSSMLSQQAQADKIKRNAELDSFTTQTKDFMADNSKTKEEKFQYIQSLPTNSEERKIANFEYEKNIRKYVPTAKKEEFISMYQNTPAYSKMSRTELGNLFNDFNAQLDGLQIFDPVERARWMENQMTQVTIDNTLIDDTMSIYQYYNKVNNDASYSAKKFSIPNEERTEIIKSLKKANLLSNNENEKKVEELVQKAYREKLQLQDSGYVEFDYGYDQKAKTFYESGNPVLN